MIQHPLVNLWFFLGFSVSLIVTSSYYGLAVHLAVLVYLVILNRSIFIPVLMSIKPIILYFPIMFLFYLSFSLWLTNTKFVDIINEAFFGFFKITIMVGSMMVYLSSTPSQDIINIARSVWIKINRPWRWVDNLFLFFTLTLRFYPTFQSNWESVKNSRISLGVFKHQSFLSKIKIAAKDLPGLLIFQLKRSEDIAFAMRLRGYGKKFPRGVTYPIPTGSVHLFKIVMITLGFWIYHNYATL